MYNNSTCIHLLLGWGGRACDSEFEGFLWEDTCYATGSGRSKIAYCRKQQTSGHKVCYYMYKTRCSYIST